MNYLGIISCFPSSIEIYMVLPTINEQIVVGGGAERKEYVKESKPSVVPWKAAVVGGGFVWAFVVIGYVVGFICLAVF